jgi:hypothetical protein
MIGHGLEWRKLLQPYDVGEMVRLGCNGDGAYIVPRDVIREADFLVSMGISDNWSFDADFQNLNHDIQIHGYDHTISKAIFIKRMLCVFFRFFILQKGVKSVVNRVQTYRDYVEFFSGQNRHYQLEVSTQGGVGATTINEIFSRTNSKKIFLKMDIEGAEYDVIDQVIQFGERIVGMAIEFHDTDTRRELFLEKIKNICESFLIVHIHGNNCAGVASDLLPYSLEISFIKKPKSGVAFAKKSKFPIPGLDMPNDKSARDYEINF